MIILLKDALIMFHSDIGIFYVFSFRRVVTAYYYRLERGGKAISAIRNPNSMITNSKQGAAFNTILRKGGLRYSTYNVYQDFNYYFIITNPKILPVTFYEDMLSIYVRRPVFSKDRRLFTARIAKALAARGIKGSHRITLASIDSF